MQAAMLAAAVLPEAADPLLLGPLETWLREMPEVSRAMRTLLPQARSWLRSLHFRKRPPAETHFRGLHLSFPSCLTGRPSMQSSSEYSFCPTGST